MQRFFGNILGDEEAALSVPSEWKRYVEAWPSLPPELKELPPAQFWASEGWRKKLRITRPLSDLGMWYANMPTSNVAAERSFSHMRAAGSSPLRRSMNLSSLREETLARCNGALVDELLKRTFSQPSSSSSSSASAAAAAGGGGSE